MTLVQNPECSVPLAPGAARADVPWRGGSEEPGVLDDGARTATTSRKGRAPRAWRRSGVRGWDPDEVAAHLVAQQPQIVRGLARRTPWAGIDDETLASLYGHAAAVIARIAGSAQRPDWRTLKDLERAQVTAYRHQALDHWKLVNAQSRLGERSTVPFDETVHQSGDAPLDRLFEHPDVLSIARDLLAELADEELHDFWTIVFTEGVVFKEAGARLEMNKAAVIAATRNGRAAFERYLEQRASGALCVERGRDIDAVRAGVATPFRAERAAAHIESCYACGLVHDPGTGAFERGLLGVAPTALLVRLLTRAGEVASIPVTRFSESSAVSRAATVAVTAAAAAGSGLGVKAVVEQPPAPKAAIVRPTPPPATARVAALVPDKIRAATVIRPPAVVQAAAAKPRRAAAAAARAAKKKASTSKAAAVRAATAAAASRRVEENEFSPEVGAQRPPAPQSAPPVNKPAPPAPPELEFGNP